MVVDFKRVNSYKLKMGFWTKKPPNRIVERLFVNWEI